MYIERDAYEDELLPTPEIMDEVSLFEDTEEDLVLRCSKSGVEALEL